MASTVTGQLNPFKFNKNSRNLNGQQEVRQQEQDGINVEDQDENQNDDDESEDEFGLKNHGSSNEQGDYLYEQEREFYPPKFNPKVLGNVVSK